MFFLKKEVFQFHEHSVQRKMIVEMNTQDSMRINKKEKFSQGYSKTRNIEKFIRKNYQKNSFCHSNIIFFTFTEVIFKVV